MTQEREKELRDEWDKIRRDLGHEHREIADYWITIMKSEINKVLEGVEKTIETVHQEELTELFASNNKPETKAHIKKGMEIYKTQLLSKLKQ